VPKIETASALDFVMDTLFTVVLRGFLKLFAMEQECVDGYGWFAVALVIGLLLLIALTVYYFNLPTRTKKRGRR
jgi:Na+/melibiose symporter-like transporter